MVKTQLPTLARDHFPDGEIILWCGEADFDQAHRAARRRSRLLWLLLIMSLGYAAFFLIAAATAISSLRILPFLFYAPPGFLLVAVMGLLRGQIRNSHKITGPVAPAIYLLTDRAVVQVWNSETTNRFHLHRFDPLKVVPNKGANGGGRILFDLQRNFFHRALFLKSDPRILASLIERQLKLRLPETSDVRAH